MRFGMQIGMIDPSRLRDVAQLAEEVGVDTLYFPDHLVMEGPERQSMGIPAYDPMQEAVLAASVTRRMKIGHLVLCNLFRHPAMTARALATLDVFSNGRAVAGLGTGWTETEFKMTGIPFPDITTRLRMLDEALLCLRGLWGGSPFSFQGEFYTLTDASLVPQPVQKPYPPIILGGSGKGLLRVAARHADVINLISDVGRAGYIKLENARKFTSDAFQAKVRFVHEEAARVGRDPSKVVISTIAFNAQVTATEADARGVSESFAGMFGATADDIPKSPLFLLGTVEQCAAELRRREREWKLGEMIVSYTDDTMLGELGKVFKLLR